MKKAVFIILAFTSSLNANEIKDRTEEILKLFFGDNCSGEMVEYVIPIDIKHEIELKCKQKFFRESVYVWKIYKETELIGYAVLDNVYGKSLPITFLVLFDNEGTIFQSTILKYREPYGGAVQNETWLEQFKGKDRDSKFGFGEDIDSVSGATISARSITSGVKKLTLLIPNIINE